MSNKHKLRRVTHRRMPITIKKTRTFTDKLQTLRFPRRAFLGALVVAAVGGGVIGGYGYWHNNYSCKTWRPGKETWEPTVYAPSEEMDPIDKAIWLVKENICRYSIEDLMNMNLQPDQVYWLMSHQLRVMPITEEYVKFYLKALHIMEPPYVMTRRLTFPVILQGHECQFLDTLLRCARNIPNLNSKEMDESWLSILRGGGTPGFKVRDEIVSLRSVLMNDIREYTPNVLGMGNSDPSWLISAYVATNPKIEEWGSYGEETVIFNYANYGFETNPVTGVSRCLSFACQGTHFLDALSRLYWYYGQFSGEYEQIAKFQNAAQRYIKAIESKNEPLEYAYAPLMRFMNWFRKDSRKEDFKEVYKCIERLGHTIELMLEPQGYYRYNYPLDDLEPAVQTLAEAIALWYTPEFDSHRELIDTWVHEGDPTKYANQLKHMSKSQKKQMKRTLREMERYTAVEDSESMYSRLFMGSLCHACRGLMLWKEYKQQQAQKPVAPTPH